MTLRLDRAAAERPARPGPGRPADRCAHVVIGLALTLTLAWGLWAASAQAQAPTPGQVAAPGTAAAPDLPPLELYRSGKAQQALDAAEKVLKTTPNDLAALFVAVRVNQERGRLDAAIGHLEAMTRHHPGLVVTWELATQVYQAADRRVLRDSALRQLIATQSAALEREVRDRRFVNRDRIDAGGRVVIGQEHFDTGGPDAIRYVFIPEHAPSGARTYLVVRTDARTTQNWQDAGILPSGKRVFQLDSVFVTPGGRPGQAMYAAYPDLPAYDEIRAKVVDILTGKARPMSGAVGGLAVPRQPPSGADEPR